MINFTTFVQFLELYLFVLDQKLRISIRVIIYVHEIYSTSHNQHGDKINDDQMQETQRKRGSKQQILTSFPPNFDFKFSVSAIIKTIWVNSEMKAVWVLILAICKKGTKLFIIPSQIVKTLVFALLHIYNRHIIGLYVQ